MSSVMHLGLNKSLIMNILMVSPVFPLTLQGSVIFEFSNPPEGYTILN